METATSVMIEENSKLCLKFMYDSSMSGCRIAFNDLLQSGWYLEEKIDADGYTWLLLKK